MYNPDGTVLRRAGVPVPRDGRTNPPPCADCPKVPDGVKDDRRRAGLPVVPADAADPGPRHRRAVEHFLECDAVRRFPADGWVRRVAAIVRPVKDAADRRPLDVLLGAIVAAHQRGR